MSPSIICTCTGESRRILTAAALEHIAVSIAIVTVCLEAATRAVRVAEAPTDVTVGHVAGLVKAEQATHAVNLNRQKILTVGMLHNMDTPINIDCKQLLQLLNCNEVQMIWLPAQVMLSVIRAITCVLASGEISIDALDEGKSIKSSVSPALRYTSSVWDRHNRNSAYIDLPHMCHNLNLHTRACMYATGIVDQ